MTMRKFLMASVAVTLGTSVGGYASAAAAQAAASPPPADNTIGEVVVTARKRAENVQRVPVAVSTASGEVLEQRGVRAVADLQKFVPSLSVDTGGPSNGGTGALFDLRGQAATDNLLTLSQAVGLYEDGVNIPHSPGSNLAFFDVARMEVAKGPQGTLYGRNTTGGAINIITKDADFNGV
ncbi:MAG: TonB-dependent receptor, partial [Phenylobacterium sp.]|nr:TonB-dependent receptor [Phenylobacterium sp.]